METEPQTNHTEEDQEILKYANQIKAAIEKKLPDHTIYVRLHRTASYAFVEHAARPKKADSPLNDKSVAYSNAFYLEMRDPAEKQKRAKRIFRDLLINLGMELPQE